MSDLSREPSVAPILARARAAQAAWNARVARHRFQAIGRLAGEIAAAQADLLAAVPRANSSPAEIIASELLPLADACHYNAKLGRRTLATRWHSIRHGAWWMGRIGVSVSREPWGLVLILPPSNYPLFLPGVQIIQALAAGNAVIVKAAPNCQALLQRFRECIIEAGIDGELVQVLGETIAEAQAVMAAGVDKVILTGSVATGQAVLRQLQPTLTPSTMELSGCDAVLVGPQADLKRVVKCLAYGLRFNGGATCIAPRRVFVTPKHFDELCEQLSEALQAGNPPADRSKQAYFEQADGFEVPENVQARIAQVVSEALADGAKIVCGAVPNVERQTATNCEGGKFADEACGRMTPLVLKNVTPEMSVAREDLFGPITSIIKVEDMAAAILANQFCPYRLAVSIFGPQNYAEHWGAKVDAGCVVINDIIVPTADPRVAFGGRGLSGWGVTRGLEGLLEMTRPKTTCIRFGRWLPHLNRKQSSNATLLGNMLSLMHGKSLGTRLSAIKAIVKEIRVGSK